MSKPLITAAEKDMLTKPALDVINEVSLADVSAQLHALADAIDEGKHGDPLSCAVVLRARGTTGVTVAAFGQTDSVAAFMDLHAGARELLR